MSDKYFDFLLKEIINREVNEVLDKIKAEIIELRIKQNVGVLDCLDIIDKYRESEDKRCKNEE